MKSDQFLQLIRTQGGITILDYDFERLKCKCRVKQTEDLIIYKEAITLLQPDFNHADPIKDPWCIRKSGDPKNNLFDTASFRSHTTLAQSDTQSVRTVIQTAIE